MEFMYELKEMLCDEVEQIVEKGELSISSLDTLHKLTGTIKNVDKILMYAEYENGGGSYDDGSEYSSRRYSRDDGNSYRMNLSRGESGESYRRGRNRMGQYTSRNSNRGYSREGGKEKMIEQLHSMMQTAETEKERESIQKCIKSIENS